MKDDDGEGLSWVMMMTKEGDSDEEEGSSRRKVARRSYAVEWSGPITYCRYGVR